MSQFFWLKCTAGGKQEHPSVKVVALIRGTSSISVILQKDNDTYPGMDQTGPTQDHSCTAHANSRKPSLPLSSYSSPSSSSSSRPAHATMSKQQDWKIRREAIRQAHKSKDQGEKERRKAIEKKRKEEERERKVGNQYSAIRGTGGCLLVG